VLRLLLVAGALSPSNIAASIGTGLTGVDTKLRLRIAFVFGAFETATPIVQLLIGHKLAHHIGSASAWVGSGSLIVVGAYTLLHYAPTQ
jgi:putative Mn2+ efflux pump MntP